MCDDTLLLQQSDLIDYSKCQNLTCSGKQCKNQPIPTKQFCWLHDKYHRYEKPEECPICLTSIKEVLKPLSCGHWAHLNCMFEWKMKNKNDSHMCPICKRNICLNIGETKKFEKLFKRKNDPVYMTILLFPINDN